MIAKVDGDRRMYNEPGLKGKTKLISDYIPKYKTIDEPDGGYYYGLFVKCPYSNKE